MGARVLIVALVLAGCETKSDLYCQKNPDDRVNCPPPIDAAQPDAKMCGSDGDCAPNRCELDSHTCVQCLGASDCSGATPICDPATLTCEACTVNADCSSYACLPTGSCAVDTTVIYVDGTAGIDTNPCTHGAQCKTIAHALTLVSSARPTVKLQGAFDEPVVFKMISVTILADPATVLTTSTGGTPTIAFMMNGSDVKIFDLELASTIKGAISLTGTNTLELSRVKIHNSGDVALTAGGGTLRLTRSRIYSNSFGGVLLMGNTSFDLTNNIIDHNGSDTQNLGGVGINVMNGGLSRFEFNTIVDNDVKSGGANVGGVACTPATFAAPNNIIARNKVMGLATDPAANITSMPCNFTGTSIATDVPTFAFTNAAGPVFDYHIGATSAAKDASIVPSSVAEDFDGNFRPQGPAKDLGADEYKP